MRVPVFAIQCCSCDPSATTVLVAGAKVRASSRRRFVYFHSSWRCVGNPVATKRSSAARRSSTNASLAVQRSSNAAR
jgi:hypothetical protein